MIPYNALEKSLRFYSSGNNLGSLEVNTYTQKFTAIAGTLPGSEDEVEVQQIINYEDPDIARVAIDYQFVTDRNNGNFILVPEVITLVTTSDTTFNTVFVIDNGSIDPGSTKEKDFAASWSTLVDASFSDPSLFRKDNTFVNPITNAYARSTTNLFAAAVVTSSIGQPATVVSYGRYLLATYKYETPITLKANTPVKVKLGKVTFQMRSS